MDLVHKFPTQVDKFAGALAKLRDSEGTTIAGFDRFGNPEQQTTGCALFYELLRFHGIDLTAVDDTSVTPSNEYLVASLLSAVSTKYKFCYSPAQVGSITRGLRHKGKRYGDTAASRQVLALGACLQLLVSGSYLYGQTGTEDVLASLEKINRARVVKDPNGRRLIEATIEQAKSGFKSDVNDAWLLLFPQDLSGSDAIPSHSLPRS